MTNATRKRRDRPEPTRTSFNYLFDKGPSGSNPDPLVITILASYAEARGLCRSDPDFDPATTFPGHPALTACIHLGEAAIPWINHLIDRDGDGFLKALRAAAAKGSGRATRKLYDLIGRAVAEQVAPAGIVLDSVTT